MRRIGLTLAIGLACAAVAAAAHAQDGQKLYNDNCSACHQKTGMGIKGAFPALAGDKLAQGDPKLLAAAITIAGGEPVILD